MLNFCISSNPMYLSEWLSDTSFIWNISKFHSLIVFIILSTGTGAIVSKELDILLNMRSTMIPALIALATLLNFGFSTSLFWDTERVKVIESQLLTSGDTKSCCSISEIASSSLIMRFLSFSKQFSRTLITKSTLCLKSFLVIFLKKSSFGPFNASCISWSLCEKRIHIIKR